MRNHNLFGLFVLSVIAFCAAVLAIPKAWAFPTQDSSAIKAQQGPSTPSALQGKKLIMKDGTVQAVSSYQVDRGRVRYFSVERSEWEEIPASLVDWPATQKAASDEAKTEADLRVKIKASEEAAKIAPIDVDASLEVVPGVFLPPGDGFFILDGKAISPMKQSVAAMKNNKGRVLERVIVPIPVIPSRTSVDLPGPLASFRITNRSPEFYFRTADLGQPEIELIRAHVQGSKRHIENIDSLFGQQEHKGQTVSLQQWQVAKGVYRFTLGQALAPGEYALAQFSPKEGIDLLLWDFGVDAHATQKNRR